MSLSSMMSVVAQLENGNAFSQGTQHFGAQVLSVKQDLGLSIMALGYDHADDTPANKAVEILLDDIELNLDSNEKRSVRLTNESLAALCLRESVENINDYLISSLNQEHPPKSEKIIGLAAILLHDNQFYCIATNDIYCFLFGGEELIPLVAPSGDPNPIGVDPALRPEVVSREYSPGNVLLMISVKDITVLGLEFVRLTLSRFKDNMEMVLQQFSVRMRRNGLKHDPALILCCVQYAEKKY
ncbi:MAG: hypothetical protein GY820_33960 [Gammaproteobacteria bacterium]|nr:hypothetical protein [Gammaproteobacteria bacterium]